MVKLKREIKFGKYWEVETIKGSVVCLPVLSEAIPYLDANTLSRLGVPMSAVATIQINEAYGCRHISEDTDDISDWNTFGTVDEATQALADDEAIMIANGYDITISI
jgi:hypothetical protein